MSLTEAQIAEVADKLGWTYFDGAASRIPDEYYKWDDTMAECGGGSWDLTAYGIVAMVEWLLERGIIEVDRLTLSRKYTVRWKRVTVDGDTLAEALAAAILSSNLPRPIAAALRRGVLLVHVRSSAYPQDVADALAALTSQQERITELERHDRERRKELADELRGACERTFFREDQHDLYDVAFRLEAYLREGSQ